MMPDQTFDHIDAGRPIDWGKTAQDYDRYRPGPPDSFYHKLSALDVGLADQQLLDVATGTGLLARRFAQQGAQVCAIDVSAEQIEMARIAAKRGALTIDYRVAPAEDMPFADKRFDIITANQCWYYFNLQYAIPEVCRMLKPHGKLVVSYFNFMPRLDPIVRASEQLVLKYNPDWSGADWDGVVAVQPRWSCEVFKLVGFFVYDEQIPFTRESWRGRMRALRGIAASLPTDQVRAFDLEHKKLLPALAGEQFNIWHRIYAYILQPDLLAS